MLASVGSNTRLGLVYRLSVYLIYVWISTFHIKDQPNSISLVKETAVYNLYYFQICTVTVPAQRYQDLLINMQLQYKKVLVLGATSGLGWALAAKFVETGTSVVIVGRRKDRLNDFAKQYSDAGTATVDTAVLDITDLKAIPQFAAHMLSKHPDLDCVFLNSGMQRAVDWTKPENINLESFELEVLTNYTRLHASN